MTAKVLQVNTLCSTEIIFLIEWPVYERHHTSRVRVASCSGVKMTKHSANLPYLLTPWYRVLLEKLTGLQLVKKFSTFHGTQRFITALTSARHLSLSWASPIQSIYPHPASRRSILILSTHLLLANLPCITKLFFHCTWKDY